MNTDEQKVPRQYARAGCLICVLLLSALNLFAQTGTVRSDGQPIPGATVTAVAGNTRLTTVTDDNGNYSFENMPPGRWLISVQIFGFQITSREVDITTTPTNLEWNLQLEPPAGTPAAKPGTNTPAATTNA